MIRNIIKVMLGNHVLANILMLLIFATGVIGTTMMVREIFPRFSLDVITVTVAYPGADPEEIEEGICLKLEEALEGIENVKEITTSASEGVGSATIECVENADVFRVKDEVKTLVDAITTFPVDAEKPIVQDVKFRGDVCALIISGDLPERQLKEIARKLENELLQIDGISQTSIGGARKYEISIEISEKNLRKYGLTFSKVSEAVAKNGINLPAGSIKTNTEDFRIRAMGRRYKAKNYENIPVIKKSDGAIITLGQIAKIKDTFDEDSELSALFNGQPAVEIGIYKTEEEDSIHIVKEVDKFIESKSKELPQCKTHKVQGPFQNGYRQAGHTDEKRTFRFASRVPRPLDFSGYKAQFLGGDGYPHFTCRGIGYNGGNRRINKHAVHVRHDNGAGDHS